MYFVNSLVPNWLQFTAPGGTVAGVYVQDQTFKFLIGAGLIAGGALIADNQATIKANRETFGLNAVSSLGHMAGSNTFPPSVEATKKQPSSPTISEISDSSPTNRVSGESASSTNTAGSRGSCKNCS